MAVFGIPLMSVFGSLYYTAHSYASMAKIIVCIGYSFNDEHINDLVKQSLEADESRRLLVVNPEFKAPEDIKDMLYLSNTDKTAVQIIFEPKGAKEFLSSHLTIEYISRLLPNVDLPF